jgi:hypothetical protein
MLMRNIERTCFTALNTSVNNTFKVSNVANRCGWHAGMKVINILDQLNKIYNMPTPTALESNDNIFHSPYLAANAPKVLFRHFEDCAKVALLGKHPYMDKQLILMAICLLLGTGLYVCTFEDWDILAKVDQTWIELHCIIQEALQHYFNAMVPTLRHQRYAPALPYMMNNSFGALGHTANNKDTDSADTIHSGGGADSTSKAS